LKIAAGLGLAFLHLPILLIFLYAFTTEEKSYAFPPPGLTLQWFGVAWNRADIWPPLWLSVQVAGLATLIAMILGTLVAAAMAQSRFFGRDQISLLILLPIALPGVITGMALRSAFSVMDIPFSVWTIILGHATFCIVIVYNNAVARFRRLYGGILEASADLGASAVTSYRRVVLPILAPAIIAGALLAFTLSVDEFIIAFFTAGAGRSSTTLPMQIYSMIRFGVTPEINAIATIVTGVTFFLVFVAQRLQREDLTP
jgi:putative spermidine/putrescine transport system permease protein